jgi:hypothetical protein
MRWVFEIDINKAFSRDLDPDRIIADLRRAFPEAVIEEKDFFIATLDRMKRLNAPDAVMRSGQRLADRARPGYAFSIPQPHGLPVIKGWVRRDWFMCQTDGPVDPDLKRRLREFAGPLGRSDWHAAESQRDDLEGE